MTSSHLPNWNEPEDEAPSVIETALRVVIMAAAEQIHKEPGVGSQPSRTSVVWDMSWAFPLTCESPKGQSPMLLVWILKVS